MSDDPGPLELKVIALQNTFMTIQCLQKLLDDQVDKMWDQMISVARNEMDIETGSDVCYCIQQQDLNRACRSMQSHASGDMVSISRLKTVAANFVKDQKRRGWYRFDG